MTNSRLSLAVPGWLVCGLVLCGVSCGENESVCRRLCRDIRLTLITNFAVDPNEIDCSDDKWDGNCAHCKEVLARDYEAAPEDPSCERASQAFSQDPLTNYSASASSALEGHEAAVPTDLTIPLLLN